MRKNISNREDNGSFGSGPQNSLGMGMTFYTSEDGNSVDSTYLIPDHLRGWGHIVHGGIIATMLDEAMGWACFKILNRSFLTKSMTIEFIQPVFTDKEIRVVGKIMKINNEREGVMGGILYNDRNEICAKSTGLVTFLSEKTMKDRVIGG